MYPVSTKYEAGFGTTILDASERPLTLIEIAAALNDAQGYRVALNDIYVMARLIAPGANQAEQLARISERAKAALAPKEGE
jgi:hypothetical protein